MSLHRIIPYVCREIAPMPLTAQPISSRVTWTEKPGGPKVHSAETSLDGGWTWRRVACSGDPVPDLHSSEHFPDDVRARLFVEAPQSLGSWPMPDFVVEINCDNSLEFIP